MRQVGVIAAAARVALEEGVERLTEDHANARILAEGLAELHQDAVELSAVETNMVYLNLRPFNKTGPQVSEALRARGVLTLGPMADSIRLVTHRDVSTDQVRAALKALVEVLSD